jgi:hypothetical protein
MGALYHLRVDILNFFSNSIKLIDIRSSSGLPSGRRTTRESCQFVAKIVRIVFVQVILHPKLYTLRRNRKRLLHPGADTRLILQQYFATTKCLRIIDPPGVLLVKVADPIRRYLRFYPLLAVKGSSLIFFCCHFAENGRIKSEAP